MGCWLNLINYVPVGCTPSNSSHAIVQKKENTDM